MATAQLITLANFSTLLVQSTQSRTGTPDGNIFFDQANDSVELITVEDLAQVNLGSGLEANPLTDALGITLQALYAFERQERGTDTALRTFLPGVEGRFQDAGAFAFVAGVKLDDVNGNAADRTKIRGSGWTEFSDDQATLIDRIYFGSRSLNNIESTSQPYIQIAASLSESDLQAAVPTNASRLGPLDQAFQVFGSTANGDTGAGNFDNTSSVLVTKVRTFGQTQGEATSTASGVARLQAFSAGFGVGEAVSPSGSFTLADVFGGAAIAPFSTMAFFRETAAQNRSGFNEADGLFTDTIQNPANGTLAQLRAFLDALMQSDNDENGNTGVTGVFRPRRADTLYTINASGQLVTRAGVYIENIPASDNQSVILTADNGDQKTFPFQNEIRVSVSDAWFNDVNAWYSCYFVDGAGSLDFDTASAVIVQDAAASNVTGTPGDARAFGSAGARQVRFTFDYSGNTQAGLSAGVDKDVIFLAEGDGGSIAARATVSIVNQSIITASAEASAETNI